MSEPTGAGEIDVRIVRGDEGAVAGHRVPPGALGAFAGATLVGFAEVHEHFYGHAFIDMLVVDEGHRRRGVASALVSACVATAPTDRVFTSTNSSNLAAQALFLGLGFEASGSIGNLDEGDPELVYCKLLDARS